MRAIIKNIGEDYFISSLLTSYHKVQPVKNRGLLPSIRVNAEVGVWQNLPVYLESNSFFYLHDLLNEGPLVLSTYSPAWEKYGATHLDRLNKAFEVISKLGANMLVISTEHFKHIIHTVQDYGIEFNVVQDLNNKISEALGVYSEFEPVWDRIAGISEDVPFPATFVISRNRYIVYDYVDKDFEYAVSEKEIERAVKIALK